MKSASFLTGGDVAPTRTQGRGMFGDVARVLDAADVSFVNLEHSLSDVGHVERSREYSHRGPPNNADGLLDAGLSCVNLANNHIMDFGEDAFFQTLEQLSARNIPWFGAGATLHEARQPHIVEVGGLRVGFLGYTTTLPRGFSATGSRAGVNPLVVDTAYRPSRSPAEYPGTAPGIETRTRIEDLERLRNDVESARDDADVVLVYVHWGASMEPHVHDFQSEIGRAAIDAGAHAVFGGHQHVLAGIEYHAGCPIFHGTGNLLFDKWEPFFTDDTLKTILVGATLEVGGIRDVYILPTLNGVEAPPQLLTASDDRFHDIHQTLADRSQRYGTTFTVAEDRIEVHASES